TLLSLANQSMRALIRSSATAETRPNKAFPNEFRALIPGVQNWVVSYMECCMAMLASGVTFCPTVGLPTDHMDERVRELCAIAAESPEGELGPILAELKTLINQRLSRSIAAALKIKGGLPNVPNDAS